MNNSKNHSVVIVSFIGLFLVVLIRNAWISDDAFITLRTVDNFVNGYGLTWNPSERVQAFTHPLWMFILSLGYLFLQKPYYLTLGISILFSLATVSFLAIVLAKSEIKVAFSLFILVFSKAFIDYSTSGLENPLSHFLLIIFLYFYLKEEIRDKRILILSFITALGMLNRMDMGLIYIPAIIYTIGRKPTRRDLVQMILGFSPLIIWEIFSLIYYGFLFPNTAYAKLNTGIAGFPLMKQGFLYILNSLSNDPLTLTVIFVGITMPFLMKDWRSIMLSLGGILYLVYIIRIGGDFMSGRFFSGLLLLSVVLIINILSSHTSTYGLLFLIGASLVIATPSPPNFEQYWGFQRNSGTIWVI